MRISLSKTRYCRPCAAEHPITAFAQYRRPNGTLNYVCRARVTVRPYDAEAARTQIQARREATPERFLLYGARKRAREQGIACAITEKDVVIPTHCPLLGIELCGLGTGTGHAASNSPSLDRIDNALAYVPGNVWVISSLANSMKRNATIDQLKTFAENVKRLF